MDDADANPTNEFQTLSQDGNEVSLSDGGGVISVADDDNDPSNEIQNIASSKEGNIVELEISNGSGTTIDVSDSDADPVNEMQTVSVAGYEVTLSDGGGTFMTGTKSYTQAEIDALTPYNGLTVHNST
nr:hypothetical protein [Bacteroidota bacterium]